MGNKYKVKYENLHKEMIAQWIECLQGVCERGRAATTGDVDPGNTLPVISYLGACSLALKTLELEKDAVQFELTGVAIQKNPNNYFKALDRLFEHYESKQGKAKPQAHSLAATQ